MLISLSINSFAQTKQEISGMIDQMKSTGQFSSEQLEAAKAQLMQMDDKQYNALINTAKQKVDDPKVRAEAMKVIGGRVPANN